MRPDNALELASGFLLALHPVELIPRVASNDKEDSVDVHLQSKFEFLSGDNLEALLAAAVKYDAKIDVRENVITFS